MLSGTQNSAWKILYMKVETGIASLTYSDQPHCTGLTAIENHFICLQCLFVQGFEIFGRQARIYPGTVFAQGGKKDMSKTQTYSIWFSRYTVYIGFLYSL